MSIISLLLGSTWLQSGDSLLVVPSLPQTPPDPDPDPVAQPPTVSTDAASNVGDSTVTLNGNLPNLGNPPEPVDVLFQWRRKAS